MESSAVSTVKPHPEAHMDVILIEDVFLFFTEYLLDSKG